MKWTKVEVDETLCAHPEGGRLLGASPSASGELWVCYIEKAVAAIMGGWDKLSGHCTHAWRLLTGCQKQYCIFSHETGYRAHAPFNPDTQQLEGVANAIGNPNYWLHDWPEVNVT